MIAMQLYNAAFVNARMLVVGDGIFFFRRFLGVGRSRWRRHRGVSGIGFRLCRPLSSITSASFFQYAEIVFKLLFRRKSPHSLFGLHELQGCGIDLRISGRDRSAESRISKNDHRRRDGKYRCRYRNGSFHCIYAPVRNWVSPIDTDRTRSLK